MFVLKKKYKALKEELARFDFENKELMGFYKELKADLKERMDKISCLELDKVGLEDKILELNQEIDLYDMTVEDLKSDIEKLEAKNNKLSKANKAMTSLWNDTNRKLWCNKESIRQLRKLSDEIIESDKINKNYIASYLHEISLYISAGIEVEAKIKEK